MTLRETIEAAKLEAQEAGSIFTSKESKEEEPEKRESTGFSKRSTARAKPVSSAASSVRVVSAEDAKMGRSGKKTSEMTKEERKAERAAVRDREDLMTSAASILLKRDEEYKRNQRIWWILLGIGLALSLIALGINYLLSHGQQSEQLVVVAMVTIMMAYVSIIAAFIFDLTKSRPIRRRVDGEVKSMSRKKLEQIVREDAEEKAAKKNK
ncbi:MAG: hypothetical protein IKE22_03070 [Atopobiaceae bacterium]|nr:hypothetical protein [Atopobiaceae bacterium]